MIRNQIAFALCVIFAILYIINGDVTSANVFIAAALVLVGTSE